MNSNAEIIMVKFAISRGETANLIEAGVRRVQVDHKQQEEQHRAVAQRLGQDPFAARPGKKIADSGTQVFGSNGLKDVLVSEVLSDLKKAGYRLVDTHITDNRKGQDFAVLLFADKAVILKRRNGISSAAEQQINNLLEATWPYCHVWANPPATDGYLIENLAGLVEIGDGLTVHTVNCVGRANATSPLTNLRFQSKQWYPTPVY